MDGEGLRLAPPPLFSLPPPPPPPWLPELCHYAGDCAAQPAISSLLASSSVLHVVSLVTITALTIVLVFAVSCIIVYRCLHQPPLFFSAMLLLLFFMQFRLLRGSAL